MRAKDGVTSLASSAGYPSYSCEPTCYWEFAHLTVLSAFFIQMAPAVSAGPSLWQSSLFQHQRARGGGMWSLLWCSWKRFGKLLWLHVSFMLGWHLPTLLHSSACLVPSLFRLLFKLSLNSAEFAWVTLQRLGPILSKYYGSRVPRTMFLS